VRRHDSQLAGSGFHGNDRLCFAGSSLLPRARGIGLSAPSLALAFKKWDPEAAANLV